MLAVKLEFWIEMDYVQEAVVAWATEIAQQVAARNAPGSSTHIGKLEITDTRVQQFKFDSRELAPMQTLEHILSR